MNSNEIKKGRPRMPEACCRIPGCNGKFGGDQEKPGGRGLCADCHGKASSLIRRKITTWQEMEDLGLAQPKYMSIVEKAIDEARKKRGKNVREDRNHELPETSGSDN